MDGVRKDNRPSLKQTSPVIYWLCWGFVIANSLIATSFMTTPPRTVAYVIVQSFFNFTFWGIAFYILAVGGTISLLWDQWKWIRRVLMLGLLIKSAWFYALALNVPHQGVAGIGVWFMIFLTQFICVVYFPQDKKERQNGGV